MLNVLNHLTTMIAQLCDSYFLYRFPLPEDVQWNSWLSRLISHGTPIGTLLFHTVDHLMRLGKSPYEPVPTELYRVN